MKHILGKMIVIGVALGATLWMGAVALINPGTADDFYRRFTTSEAPSLILGSSRAAQGLNPKIFNQSEIPFQGDMLNFSFTVSHSPYGQSYLESISGKVSESARDGLFLLAVDPWVLASKEDGAPRETESFIGSLHVLNANPNLEYLLRYAGYTPSSFLFDPAFGSKTFLHRNGWLEVSVDTATRERIEGKMSRYREHMENWADSVTRWDALEDIARMLENRGNVFFVRLPTSPEMRELERDFAPHFDTQVEELSREIEISYINLIDASGEYLTSDGNHIWHSNVPQLTRRVRDSVSAHLVQK